MDTRRVLLTGFGPFPGAEKNVSWEAVNNLNKEEIETKHNIHLIREKLEVSYDHVDSFVPKHWAKHQPDLTIHVGVKPNIKSLHLELEASREGYEFVDILQNCPKGMKHSFDGPDVICTKLDLQKLVDEFNSSSPVVELEAKLSTNAGKFVCEYTYYGSLVHNVHSPQKTLFIHIPVHSCPEQIALCLERIIEICLQHQSDDQCLVLE